MNNKEIAQTFLQMVVEGKIDQAYEQFIAKEFRHHNIYCAADTESLKQGMKSSHTNFPNKQFTIHQVLSDGNLVATHSLMKFDENHPGISVVHIMKIENQKITEMWDIGQPVPEETINQNGLF